MRGLQTQIVALCALALAGRAAEVTVDRENRRAEVLVSVPDGRLVITLDPMTSLLVHCTNLYGLNRQPGARYYKVREDERAKAAVEGEIQGGARVYEPAMEALIASGAYRRYPTAELLNGSVPEPMNRVMAFTWERFYKDYWDREFDRLLGEFRAMNDGVGWAEALGKMERYTGRAWHGEMYIVAAEGTGKSAFTAGRNISVGAPGANEDAGFVHEGLHLMLREEWAQDPRIQKIMAGKPPGTPPYTRWQARYEQAVVASLDILIRGLDRFGPAEKVAAGYFEGLRLGAIAPVVWPLVKAHAENPAERFEDLMLKIVTQCERP